MHSEIYFNSLANLLGQGGAKKELLDDLAALDRGLMPFDGHSVKDFSQFLVTADEYKRTGVFTPVKPVKPAPKPRKTTGNQSAVEVVAGDIKALYDRAPASHTSADEIEAGIVTLQPLTKPQLKTVAAAIGIKSGLSAKNKAEITKIIADALRRIWGTNRRVNQ